MLTPHPEFIMGELGRALDAEAASDHQVRELVELIDLAAAGRGHHRVADVARLVGVALAVNTRLEAHRQKLQKLAQQLKDEAEAAQLTRLLLAPPPKKVTG